MYPLTRVHAKRILCIHLVPVTIYSAHPQTPVRALGYDRKMADPGLRADAARNHERLMAAGREVFAQRGLGATLNDVAKHAGLGVGTAYRRFADKSELIEAILEQQVEELVQILDEALAEPDAWKALVDYLERSLAIQAENRWLAQIFSGQRVGSTRYDWQHDRLAALADQLAERARDQGVVRVDLTGTDLQFLQIGIAAIAGVAADGAKNTDRSDIEQLYRRYLWMTLDGLRPGHPDPLPVPALTTAQTRDLLSPDPQ